MKLTLSPLLLIVLLAGVSAGRDSHAQEVLNQRVSLRLKQAAFRNVLTSIEQQTNVTFMYSAEVVQADRKVSLTAHNVPLGDVFSRLFGPLQISYEIVGNRIILTKVAADNRTGGPLDTSEPSNATSPEVVAAIPMKGKVVDNRSQPLPGVSIVVVGTSAGTTTDAQGNYQLDVPATTSMLVFSMVGYEAQTIQAGTRTVLNITLAEDVKSLSEVVVVGYGTQKKKDLTGSVSQVSGEELTKVTVTSIDQALQGRAAGVVVTSNDGTPGGSNSVRIRGLSSVNNNDPLYVVDGIIAPNGISTINPSDIETIDILKDASATAIYGVQAANGVIIVSTKKGKAGKAQITFDAYQGVQSAWRQIPLMNARELGKIINEGIRNALAQSPELLNNPDLRENPNVDSYGEGTNWQKEVFRSARMQDYAVGLSGGTTNTTYSFGAGYRDQDGIIINSGYKRYTMRANVENRSNRFTVGAGVNYGYSVQHALFNNTESNGVLFTALSVHPLTPVRDPQDPTKYGKLPVEYATNHLWAARVRNPVSVAEPADNTNTNQNLWGTLYGEYELLKGLKFRSQIGVSYYVSGSKSFGIRAPDVDEPVYVNSLYEGSYAGIQWNWDNTLSYYRWINGHNIGVVAGVSAQNRRNDYAYYSQAQFDNEAPALRYIGFGDPKTLTGTAGASERSLYSQFVRGTYDYKERYYVTGTVRFDRSSAFAPQNRLGTFPSASVGWRISRESFLQDVKQLTDFKLRASWGITGNQSSVDDYPLSTRITSSVSNSGYVLGPGQDGIVSGARPTRLGNDKITWETTEQTDLGADIALWDNKIQLTLDYYKRTTRDMLLQKPLPATITGGADYPFVNLGSVANTGFEFAVTYNQRINDFKFSVSANGATLKNTVLDLGPSQYLISPYATNAFSTPVNRTFVGSSIATFYGYKTDGLFKTQAEVDQANQNAVEKSGGAVQYAQTAGTRAGDQRFKDLNGDGVIDDKDKTIIGNPLPKFSYGFNLSASYKNFDFSAFLQGVTGNQVFNVLRFRGMGDFSGGSNKFALLNDHWTPENPNATYPRIITTDPNLNWTGGRISSLYVEDGAYVRLRSLQLGYTLPAPLLKKISMQRLRVYTSAQNLFTITKYYGFDPEIGLNSMTDSDATRNLQIGVDKGAYPQPRTFLLGINATF